MDAVVLSRLSLMNLIYHIRNIPVKEYKKFIPGIFLSYVKMINSLIKRRAL